VRRYFLVRQFFRRLSGGLDGDWIEELSIQLRPISEQTLPSTIVGDVIKTAPAEIAPELVLFDHMR